MKIAWLDMPDDPTELARWLERQLVGMELLELIESLERARTRLGCDNEPDPSLENDLQSALPAILEEGLSAAPPALIRRLLKRPRTLAQLQDRILEQGGRYWTELPCAEPQRQRIETIWQAVQADPDVRRTWSGGSESGGKRTPSPGVGRMAPAAGQRRRWIAPYWLGGIVLAASLLVAAFVFWPTSAGDQAWGWNRPGVMTAATRAEYLERLADAADEWFSLQRDEPRQLQQRLEELVAGCQRLIDAPHEPLPESDRDWLVEKCRAWKETLDGQLAEIRRSPDSFERVRPAADETVQKLVTALRTRAASPG